LSENYYFEVKFEFVDLAGIIGVKLIEIILIYT